MKLIITSIVVLAGLTVSAAETTTTTTTTTTTAIGSTPTSVCQAIVDSAKSKNFEGMTKWTTAMPAHHKKMKMNKTEFAKMGSKYFEKMQDLTCGTEIVAQDHAIIESESQGQKRLIPFVKKTDGWKFDLQTYHSFYEGDSHEKNPHKM